MVKKMGLVVVMVLFIMPIYVMGEGVYDEEGDISDWDLDAELAGMTDQEKNVFLNKLHRIQICSAHAKNHLHYFPLKLRYIITDIKTIYFSK